MSRKPIRDPDLPPRETPPDPSVTWACRCGKRVLAHVGWCPACGEFRPKDQA